MTMNDSHPPKPKRRWYRLTPERLVLGLLAVQVFLFLSDRFQWLAFIVTKGWTVVTAVGVAGLAVLVMLIWLIVSLLLRRRFQFSLRILLVFVVVLSVPLGWFAMKMQKARKQREVVEAILEVGGRVSYTPGPIPLKGGGFAYYLRAPRAPLCLREWLGDDFFYDVIRVDLTFSRVTDGGLVHLKGFTSLKRLNLKGTRVTDAGLENLKGLTSLEMLRLQETNVTDAGVKKLQEALPNCEIRHYPLPSTERP